MIPSYYRQSPYYSPLKFTIMCMFDRKHEVFSFESDCFTCEWFNMSEYACAAYPEGIPDRILSGRVKHRKVMPDQTGSKVYQLMPKPIPSEKPKPIPSEKDEYKPKGRLDERDIL